MSDAKHNPAARATRARAETRVLQDDPAPDFQLDDLLEEPVPTVHEWTPPPEDTSDMADVGYRYDGRSVTRLPVAFPMMRDHKIIGQGDFIDVKAVQHPVTRRWHGTEAAHVEDLFRMGCIAGTPEARQRLVATVAVEHERGVHTPTEKFPKGRQDLRSLTTDDVKRQWERVLGRGPADVIRMERQEVKSDASAAQDMAKAAEQLARASRVIETLATAKERMPQGHVGSSPEEQS